MNVLFWNTKKNNLDELIVELAVFKCADLIILAEYEGDQISLLAMLRDIDLQFERVPIIGCKKIVAFYNMSRIKVSIGPDSTHYSSFKIHLPYDLVFLCVAVHLPSKRENDSRSQASGALRQKNRIEEIEKKLEIDKTFVVGDFNMNPFDEGMVGATAFHSVSCKNTIRSRKGKRIIDGEEYSFFYNPMWNLLGDYSGHPGTLYYSSSNDVSYYWNMLDQVIIRPSLIDYFDMECLSIIGNTGKRSLENRNKKPSSTDASDHFPIFFSFNIDKAVELQ